MDKASLLWEGEYGMTEGQAAAILMTLVIDLVLFILFITMAVESVRDYFALNKDKDQLFEGLFLAAMFLLGMLYVSTPVLELLLKQ